jgi:hypothetical protein
VLPKLAYLTLCRSVQLLALPARGDAAKDLEILVLDAFQSSRSTRPTWAGPRRRPRRRPARHQRLSPVTAGWGAGLGSGRRGPLIRRPNTPITGMVEISGTSSQIGRCAHHAGVGWLGGR